MQSWEGEGEIFQGKAVSRPYASPFGCWEAVRKSWQLQSLLEDVATTSVCLLAYASERKKRSCILYTSLPDIQNTTAHRLWGDLPLNISVKNEGINLMLITLQKVKLQWAVAGQSWYSIWCLGRKGVEIRRKSIEWVTPVCVLRQWSSSLSLSPFLCHSTFVFLPVLCIFPLPHSLHLPKLFSSVNSPFLFPPPPPPSLLPSFGLLFSSIC